MSAKFGQLTVNQIKKLCENNETCSGCPIREYCSQIFYNNPCIFKGSVLDAEIDLSDEENKK